MVKKGDYINCTEWYVCDHIMYMFNTVTSRYDKFQSGANLKQIKNNFHCKCVEMGNKNNKIETLFSGWICVTFHGTCAAPKRQ